MTDSLLSKKCEEIRIEKNMLAEQEAWAMESFADSINRLHIREMMEYCHGKPIRKPFSMRIREFAYGFLKRIFETFG